MPFTFENLDLPGVVLVQPRFFPDERGGFMETYRYSQFAAAGITDRIVQFNVSISSEGVLRGIHYQVDPDAQGKLVAAFRGAIYDVVVDVTLESPTYGQWRAVRLSDENRTMLYIPPGYGHAFCVLSDFAQVCYGTTAEYAPESERGVRWNDPALAIDWPVQSPIVSARDQELPFLTPARGLRSDSTART